MIIDQESDEKIMNIVEEFEALHKIRLRMGMKMRVRSLIDRLVPLPEYVSAELLMLNARPTFCFLLFSVSVFC